MLLPGKVLKDVFGYDEFRSNQKEVIEHTLSGQDALTIMPTGGGKSVCYQIPAIIKPNLTIVISPLISLMKDQVESLRSNGVEVAYYNSSLSDTAKEVIRNRALHNDLKILYLSPETLVGGIGWIRKLNVSLIAIDEAHCVSSWGHDFRPEYRQIGELRKHFPNVPFTAFTATADKITRKDIVEKLALNTPAVFITSFDRPNLSLSVRPQVPKAKKRKEVLDFLDSRIHDSGIIYCLSRKETEDWSSFLNTNGYSARHYHAGLSNEERDLVQESFTRDETQIICATIAFGMGIDKPNVRWVIHNNLPKNIEGYYQEIGRAGRDGLPSDTILYYNYRDVVLLNDFISDSDFKDVYRTKVNRMLQYAEATSCRRKILLAYFGEHLLENCGNCDICASPPDFMDGTIIAQKALSASRRSQENLGINLMVNVLRGAQTAEIFDRGLHQLKTYGVGKEYSFKEWQHFINQLVNQGVFEIAYDQGMALKITSFGEAILRGEQSIDLTEFKERQITKKKKSDSVTGPANEELQNELKEWRTKKAKANHVPPYVIFNDKTLQELSSKIPTKLEQLPPIQGLGKVKIDRFGRELIDICSKYKQEKLSTYDQTFQLYEKGATVEQIAEIRKLSPQTVYNHLIKLYEEGKKVDLFQFITEQEIQNIKFARKKLNNTFQLKPIHDALEGSMSYPKISIGLAILARHV